MEKRVKNVNFPWSIKGVSTEARDFAKTAASKNGLTMGDWLTKGFSRVSKPFAEKLVKAAGLPKGLLANAGKRVMRRAVLSSRDDLPVACLASIRHKLVERRAQNIDPIDYEHGIKCRNVSSPLLEAMKDDVRRFVFS